MATERQILANRRNRMLWRGITAVGRLRLSQAALQNRPWEHSTGPKTQAGKNRSKMNALRHGGRSKVVRIKLDLIARLIRDVRRPCSPETILKRVRRKMQPDRPL